MWFEVGGARVFAQTGGRSIDPLLPTVVMIHGAGTVSYTHLTLPTKA